MTEFVYLVEYKGGTFEKHVYADNRERADQAIAARYASNPDFTVLRLVESEA